jgi:hypothetical protein
MVPAGGIIPKATREADWWDAQTKGMNFSKAGHVNPLAVNLVVWKKEKGKGWQRPRAGAESFACCHANTKPW